MNYEIKTEGLHCGHCDASVEAALLRVEGVIDADSDHETQTVEVEVEEDVAGDIVEAMKTAVEAAGDFKVVSIRER